MNKEVERVTIYDVAKACKMSVATVSRVINNSNTVRPETKKKVLSIIDELGYKPSGVAQSLATNKSTQIGVIIPNANYVYLSNFLNGVTEVSKKYGFFTTLYTTNHSRDDALNCLEKAISSHTDGVIIFDDELDSEDLETFNSYGVPVVYINAKITGDMVASINFSYQKVLKQIIMDNILKGDKQMTFMHVHNGGKLLNNIEEYFIKIHNENDRTYDIANCDDSYTRTYNDFVERFKKKRREYIIAYRDSIAAAAINAAQDSGLRIPEDIEVLSLIGTKYSNIIRPKISNLFIDMQDVGRRATYMLVDLINNKLKEKNYTFECTFIRHDTTKLGD